MKSQILFSAFLGIDWSGAKAKHHAGLQLALAMPGASVPRRVAPPVTKYWSRQQVFGHLLAMADAAAGHAPVLVGIDFAFAHPFVDEGGYFPSTETALNSVPTSKSAPNDIAALWALVDAVNQGQPDFYGGAMFSHEIWGDYYLSPPHYQADRYASRRRVTEISARNAGRSPSPTFKAVGADNVSTGSLAGMRLLHRLRQRLGRRLSVWPFDDIVAGVTDMVLVEIFPSFYFYRLGMVPAKKAAADPAFLGRALAQYDSEPVADDFIAKGHDADEADAIIAAAALRFFARNLGFDVPLSVAMAARYEGWIFGVPYQVINRQGRPA